MEMIWLFFTDHSHNEYDIDAPLWDFLHINLLYYYKLITERSKGIRVTNTKSLFFTDDMLYVQITKGNDNYK